MPGTAVMAASVAAYQIAQHPFKESHDLLLH